MLTLLLLYRSDTELNAVSIVQLCINLQKQKRAKRPCGRWARNLMSMFADAMKHLYQIPLQAFHFFMIVHVTLVVFT